APAADLSRARDAERVAPGARVRRARPAGPARSAPPHRLSRAYSPTVLRSRWGLSPSARRAVSGTAGGDCPRRRFGPGLAGQPVDRAVQRDEVELARGVLAEARQPADLEALAPEPDGLPRTLPEAPDDPAAVVAVQ